MVQLLQHLLQNFFLVVSEKHIVRSDVWLDWNKVDRFYSLTASSRNIGELLPLELQFSKLYL